jgi:hypothetical protein
VAQGGAAKPGRSDAKPAPERPAALESARPGEKLAWSGRVRAVRPRISLSFFDGEPKHGYEGYLLVVNGRVADTPGWFSVAVGPAAQVKHRFEAGVEASGVAVPVARGAKEVADLYKASGLEVTARQSPEPGEPPWLGPPPPLEEYRARGYVRLGDAFGAECRVCVWACRMPTEGEPEPVAVCYGPATCRLRPPS